MFPEKFGKTKFCFIFVKSKKNGPKTGLFGNKTS